MLDPRAVKNKIGSTVIVLASFFKNSVEILTKFRAIFTAIKKLFSI
jgi:hypothetical protein